ncbi:MAG: hypothetical protein ACTSYL_06665 [Candidatus Thorarchaeota archaeon]
MILLDCAIEVIPPEIRSLKQIQQYCSRRKKRPNMTLLDQSRHGQAMTRLPNQERRGRPDITFLTLMGLLETPLCKAGLLSIHLHLQDGRIIEVRPDVRLPRNYDRFIGLLEQLLNVGRVPPTGEPLLRITDLVLPELLTSLKADHTDAQVFLASENGTPTTLHDLVSHFPLDSSIPVIFGVGAFPHGDMGSSIVSLFDETVSLDPATMMTWHVSSEILWLYSYRLNLSSSTSHSSD